jgi:general secretion pathway protein F
MTLFHYSAVDRSGVALSGKREGATKEEILGALLSSGHTPTSIHEVSGWSLARLRLPVQRGQQIARRDIVMFTQSLHPLLRAGLNLDRALGVLIALQERVSVKRLLDGLLRSVREGRSFADALAEEPAFPPYYIAMTRAGELGGSLTQVVGRLSEFLNRSERIRERLTSALIYPMMLAGMIVLTLVLLVTIVLPRFERMFAESHAVLPLPTRIVLNFGTLVLHFGWLMALAFATTVFWAYRSLKRPAVRLTFDRWLLRSRVTFGLIARVETSRFLRTLGTLISNGIPAVSALRVARGVIVNRALVYATDGVITSVREGQSLAALLAREPLFPKVAAHLARVGEETGQLDTMLLEAADILDRDVETTTERLLSILVPAITIGMGVLVAGLIGSVLVGILSVNDLAF